MKQSGPLSWFSKHHSSSASRTHSSPNSISKEAPTRPGSPVASISLPAISSSAVEAGVVGRENTMHVIKRMSIRDRISPHFVLGRLPSFQLKYRIWGMLSLILIHLT